MIRAYVYMLEASFQWRADEARKWDKAEKVFAKRVNNDHVSPNAKIAVILHSCVSGWCA
jgi:hypothetical protein